MENHESATKGYCNISKIAYVKGRHPLREIKLMRFIPAECEETKKNLVNYISFSKDVSITYIENEVKNSVNCFSFPINSMFVVKDCKNQKHAYCVIDENNNEKVYHHFGEPKIFEIVEYDAIVDTVATTKEIDKNLYDELKLIHEKSKEVDEDIALNNIYELMDFCELI